MRTESTQAVEESRGDPLPAISNKEPWRDDFSSLAAARRLAPSTLRRALDGGDDRPRARRSQRFLGLGVEAGALSEKARAERRAKASNWIHRAFHRVPALWRFHAVHHSAETMDWLAGSRLHLVDVALTRGLTYVPIYVLGFAEGPQFHHWHHAADPAAVDKNFAVHLPVLDRRFGSYHVPEGQWPAAYGIAGGVPVPEGFVSQFAHPFRKLDSPGGAAMMRQRPAAETAQEDSVRNTGR